MSIRLQNTFLRNGTKEGLNNSSNAGYVNLNDVTDRNRVRDENHENQIYNLGVPTLKGYEDSYMHGVRARSVNVGNTVGGFGWCPDFKHLAANTPFVSRDLIPILLRAPLGMHALPNAREWIKALRSLIETQAIRIEGFTGKISLEVDSYAFGGGGAQMHAVTNSTYEQYDVTITYQELQGMPIYRFHSGWIRLLIMDPEAKIATINTIPKHTLSDGLLDQYTFDAIFIETDPTGSTVVQAFLVLAAFPTDTGDNTAVRDIANAKTRREISITYKCTTVYNAGVDEFAQIILDSINNIGADPHARESSVDAVSAYIRSLEHAGSYGQTVERIKPGNRVIRSQYPVSERNHKTDNGKSWFKTNRAVSNHDYLDGNSTSGLSPNQN